MNKGLVLLAVIFVLAVSQARTTDITLEDTITDQNELSFWPDANQIQMVTMAYEAAGSISVYDITIDANDINDMTQEQCLRFCQAIHLLEHPFNEEFSMALLDKMCGDAPFMKQVGDDMSDCPR